jgi:hypothetical protein
MIGAPVDEARRASRSNRNREPSHRPLVLCDTCSEGCHAFVPARRDCESMFLAGAHAFASESVAPIG